MERMSSYAASWNNEPNKYQSRTRSRMPVLKIDQDMLLQIPMRLVEFQKDIHLKQIESPLPTWMRAHQMNSPQAWMKRIQSFTQTRTRIN